jgi:hypothetical protein
MRILAVVGMRNAEKVEVDEVSVENVLECVDVLVLELELVWVLLEDSVLELVLLLVAIWEDVDIGSEDVDVEGLLLNDWAILLLDDPALLLVNDVLAEDDMLTVNVHEEVAESVDETTDSDSVDEVATDELIREELVSDELSVLIVNTVEDDSVELKVLDEISLLLLEPIELEEPLSTS